MGALLLGAAPLSARTVAGGETAAAGRATLEPLQLARVWPSSDLEGAVLLTLFDDTHRRFDDGSFEVLLWPGHQAKLEQTGVRHRITVDDVVAWRADADRSARRAAQPDVPGPAYDDYRFLDDYEAEMLALADAHPDKVRVFELPLRSLEGRRLLGMEICDRVAEDDGRPVFYMDGLIHAREWPAGELMMTFAYDLVENGGSDARIAGLMAGARTVLVPVVNPDGFVESREALVQTRNSVASLALAIGGRGGEQAYWRKNKRSFTELFYETLNPDAHGIDANRNFGQQWGGPGTTNINAGLPESQSARGDAPFSEPEAENCRRLLLSHQVMAANSSHTYSELILFPQGHTAGSPDEDLLRGLAEKQADDTARLNPSRRYRPEAIIEYAPGGLVGTTCDWVYAATGAMSYTYEHGNSNDFFHPPYDRQADLYARMREAFLTLGESALDTSLHGVISGRVVRAGAGGGPAPATIRVEKDFRINLWEDGNGDNDTGESSIPERVDTTMRTEDGRFDYHVAPSARPFETDVPGVDADSPYRVTITTDDGDGVIRNVRVGRGETIDLGTIVI